MDVPVLSLTAAVRCHVERVGEKQRHVKVRPAGWRSQPLGERVLVLDTETSTDRFQNLLAGYYEVYQYRAGHHERIERGLIAGDVLTREQTTLIQVYADRHGLQIFARVAFVRDVFLPEVHRLGTLCVGFNLPFDLSRLAVRWVPSRGRNRGGFTFYLTHDLTQPSIRVKALDSTRAFIALGSPWKPGRREARGRQAFPGRFLDLKTLALALTGTHHSLESACEAFRVTHPKGRIETYGLVSDELLDYLCRDVLATAELYEAMLTDWHRHPFAPVPTPLEVEHDPDALLVTKAYSPATLAKAYLRHMGVAPRLAHQPSFPKPILGRAMAAYFGGRSECHVRRRAVRVTYLDVLSMYPTVAVLMRIFRLMAADRVKVEDATDWTRRFLKRVSLDDALAPETWPDLCVLVEVEPDGDLLPVRAAYQEGGDYQIGLNVVTVERGVRLYYMLPDLVASKVLTGKAPRIRRAWRLRARGRQSGLRRVKLPGDVDVDPRRDDFIRLLIERRHEFQQAQGDAERRGDGEGARHLDAIQNGLKIVANSIYGVLAEVDDESAAAHMVEVFGVDRFVTQTSRDEKPGPYTFAPLAALITSGARLVLAIVEAELRKRGATHGFCDTDSVAATGDAKVVEAVRRRLARLIPYAFGGDLLKVEDENYALKDPTDPKGGVDRTRLEPLYCVAISAKRYALLNRTKGGDIIVRRASEHGLGHLLSPSRRDEETWIGRMWRAIVQDLTAEKHTSRRLPFADTPALAQFSISRPSILKLFDRLNTRVDPATGKRVALPHTRQVKPFNFMLVAFADTGDITTGGEAYWDQDETASASGIGQPIRPVAPYESDREKWPWLDWVDRHTGRPVRLAWGQGLGGMVTQAIRVQTYSDVQRRHAIHPEAKAAGPDGQPCGFHTMGELGRLHVRVVGVEHIGKESRDLEDVQAGLEVAASTYTRYVDRERQWEQDKQTLKPVPRKTLAKWSGLHVRSIKAILNTVRLPQSRHRKILHEMAEKLRRPRSDTD